MAGEGEPIYLDYNATTPIVDQSVRAGMIRVLDTVYGNPSSSHPVGAAAKRVLEIARTQVAACVGSNADEIVFTSGGTESDNMAVLGAARLFEEEYGRAGQMVSSAIEHPAIEEALLYLEKKRGWTIARVSVSPSCLVSAADVRRAIEGQQDSTQASSQAIEAVQQTALVTIMHSNNETGALQPIAEISSIVKELRGNRTFPLMHTDAAQSVGKVSVSVQELGVDLLTIAGHKIYAPKGIGALFIRRGLELPSCLYGAEQEMRRRPGTENVMLAVGLGEACAVARRDLDANAKRMAQTRDLLLQLLRKEIGSSLRVNGPLSEEHTTLVLPNTLNVSFRGVEANTLLSEIENDVAASAGAACHSDRIDVSPVLTAMGVPVEWAMGTIRLSVGKPTTEAQARRAAEVIVRAVRPLLPEGAGEVVPACELQEESNPEAVRLTQYTHGLGCACKLRPQALEMVLRNLPVPKHPDLLVGVDTFDDAAVFKIAPNLCCVASVDFFTPVVDSPYGFGQVAAANSMSDLYAMGVAPTLALNVCGFPSGRLPLAVLTQILRGANAKAEEAGMVIAGGHTVEDTEPKFGMCVLGFAEPSKILTNSGAKVGDVLILTKPIGTGILTTALKRRLAGKETQEAVTKLMSTLNNHILAVLAAGVPVNACTDVTGFGLVGHVLEVARSSCVCAEISAASVPVMPRALELAASGCVPGGTTNNVEFTLSSTTYDDGVAKIWRLLLCDAQTSGGLVLAVAPQYAERCCEVLRENDAMCAALIGRCVEATRGQMGSVSVVP